MEKKSSSLHDYSTELSSIEIGADLRVKPSAIANALQEAARKHADSLGWGVETIQQKKLYWVLARTRVEIAKRPGYASKITIHTWPKGTAGRYALRDFEGSANQRDFLKATSSWLLVDALTGRPASVDQLSELFNERANEHAIETPAEKITIPEKFDGELVVEPLYSDLDVLGHVNNARYLDWAWSAVPEDIRMRTKGWTVNYLKEVKAGQTMTVKARTTPSEATVVGFNKNQKPAFLVSFHIE